MYGREKLKYKILDKGDYQGETKAYIKSEADSVMDDLEAQVKILEKANAELIKRVQALEEDCNKLEATISISETTEPKWISVEDVLPQWGKLVKIKFKDGKEDERRFSADYKWVSKGMRTCESVNVTHWMPLPPPPTTEDSSAIVKEK